MTYKTFEKIFNSECEADAFLDDWMDVQDYIYRDDGTVMVRWNFI